MKNKNLIILFCFACLVISGVSAEEGVFWGSKYGQGNLIPGVAAAVERDSGLSLALYPSLEIIAWKPRMGSFSFIDLGLALSGRIGIPLQNSSLAIGPALSGTMHLGFCGFDFPGSAYLGKVDVYASLGLGADIVSRDGFKLRLAVASGINYFIDERFSIGVGYTQWGEAKGVKLELRYRFGKNDTIAGMKDIWAEGKKAVDSTREIALVSQFYAFYFMAFYSGGFWWAPESWQEGDEILWRYQDKDSEYFIEKAYIEKTKDGTQWWRMHFYNNDEDIWYEFSLTPDQKFGQLFYREGTSPVVEYHFEQKNDAAYLNQASQGKQVTEKDLSARAGKSRRVDIKVPAGTFKQCYQLEDKVDGETYTWYFAEKDVPGALVKQIFTDENETITGELFKILPNAKGQYRIKGY